MISPLKFNIQSGVSKISGHLMNDIKNYSLQIMLSFELQCDKMYLLIYISGKNLGPVVQSIVSLTSSLRVISLTVLADSIHNILIFFAEKM